ncbi:protein Shroom4 isoform X2 [Elgaria multicarinata webbii]|uniref:protein Shroom4 isoform X2 n=1 Tax=Elgaria multicarinata webbii TaxID=159646 RepID=UPI002FCD5310
MERPSGQAQRAQPDAEPAQQQQQQQQTRLASRLLVSFQYVHVQLSGGAPWGFTLKGGLEHGEPLIVSKVEDGGKAALSQKMRSGDELVNINGTPLYGSRQEALILIKGSYRTLKMIIRRRNVPVIRPHSWHLAKLSEVRTEVATMHFPADAFSLSWHSGCDTSDLPLPWTPLSRHCSSTDKSSSLGSMESLDQPSQTYYEGSLSPIDQAMYQNKRDSAYSSFSASSNTSDSALRPEESGSAECAQTGQPLDPRYLQTGGEGGEPAGGVSLHCLGLRPASSTQASPFLGLAKAAATPPQPPVRQDSLRACNPEAPRTDSLHAKGRWASDTSLCTRSRDPRGPGGQSASAGHTKEPLSTDQYYLLSSHTDQHPAMEKGAASTEGLSKEDCGTVALDDPPTPADGTDLEAKLGSQEAWKGWSGPMGHRHSAPEQLLAAQLKALNVAPGQEGPRWTVSPLHTAQKSTRAPELWQGRDHNGQSTPLQAEEPGPCPAAVEGSRSPKSSQAGLERPRSASAELAPSLPLHPSGDAGPGLQAAPSTEALAEGERDLEGGPAARRGHRSAQMRRRSDRFATNLRNEIQWRKAQLQKSKGSAALLCGEQSVQETEEPADVPSPPAPPAPPAPSPLPPAVESRPPSSAPLRETPPKRWGSELSVFGGESASHSPSRTGPPAPEPRWASPLPELERPQRAVPPTPGGGRRGRWRWSPEHKLQPHDGGLPATELASPSRLPEESGLLPFADRRRFFEETSKPLSSAHLSSHQGRLGVPQPPRMEEQNAFQPFSSERRDRRRHSVDQSYGPPSSPPVFPDFRADAPGIYKPLARHGGDCECWRPPPCSFAPREACAYCYGDRFPPLLQRNVSVPSSHCAHRCHPRPWSRCSDCCCPAQRKLLEDGGPWQGRKPFQMEFPVDEWEPPAINRKSSQSMSELVQHKMGFARVGPFWTCCETVEPEWPPFCRSGSTRNLSWDCERPGRAAESPPYEEGPGETHRHPLRERAYSESHLCVERAGASGREKREAPLAKLEETGLESPPRMAQKKGPPPPRPPPPNWEKYRPRRASHNQLLLPKAGLAGRPEGPGAPSQSGNEAARQRSQSLPLEQVWNEAARLQRYAAGSDAPLPGEQGNLRYYCHSSPRRTPEWPTPDTSERSGSSRPASSLEVEEEEEEEEEEVAAPEPTWEEEQNRSAGRNSEQPPACTPGLASTEHDSAPEGAGGESCPPRVASATLPLRLNSAELMRDVVGRDRSLASVLSPTLGLVTAAEVMGDLFSPGECPVWKGQDWAPQAEGVEHSQRPQTRPVSPTYGGAISPTSCSAYYNMSAGKAELLNKMKELPESAAASSEEEELDHDLARKKLIESISRKLAVLQEAQRGLQDDVTANVALGKEVESHVKGVCKPHEFEKFRLFIGDLDKVVNLLLSLSGRLARVENALGGLDSNAPEEEKLALLEKKRQLTAQLEDAKELQEHVARRERVVFASVSRCLPGEQLQDYQHFVRMKSALAIQQRQLDDKIKLGEEQLRCLRESLRRAPRDY